MDEMVCLRISRLFIGFIGFVVLNACAERATLAPVVEYNWHQNHGGISAHKVLPGDTLYAIAFRYEMDYQQLAAINHIHRPYRLVVGQKIYLSVPRSTLRSRLRVRPPLLLSSSDTHVIPWLWPARGVILAHFAPQLGQKGMDIAGDHAKMVVASAAGTVAYAGDGLAGYGNLILLKHPHNYLSAYGYNARNLVHLGQKVRAGQAIAIIGMNQQQRYAVHFEIRKSGRPVNPRVLLP